MNTMLEPSRSRGVQFTLCTAQTIRPNYHPAPALREHDTYDLETFHLNLRYVSQLDCQGYMMSFYAQLTDAVMLCKL